MMKKIICIILSAICLLLTSCVGLEGKIWRQDESDAANDLLKKIVGLIQNRDKEGIKNLFSKKGIRDGNDIDANLDYVFDVFKGKIIEWPDVIPLLIQEDRANFKRTRENSFYADIKTDVMTYRVTAIVFPEDTIDPDNQGVYALSVLPKEYWEKHFTYADTFKQYPGVYNPNTCIPPK